MEKITDGLVEVGDTLCTKNLGTHNFMITRTTKTLAMSKRPDGYEHKFKRAIGVDMGHPYERWNTTTYTVWRNT